MKVLILDNYDSFTYNLVQYIEEILEQPVEVYRNDAIALEAVDRYDVIVLSPGPGVPAEAGIMPALIKKYAPSKHILGVCLGHQAIGEAFGADLENLQQVFHGIESEMQVLDPTAVLFQGLGASFKAGRYHSWVIKKNSMPETLKVTAIDDTGEIMALEHKKYKVQGLQFHPESIMTPKGKKMLKNFFDYAAQNLSK